MIYNKQPYLSTPRTALKTASLSAVVLSLFLYWYVTFWASLSLSRSSIPGAFVNNIRPTLNFEDLTYVEFYIGCNKIIYLIKWQVLLFRQYILIFVFAKLCSFKSPVWGFIPHKVAYIRINFSENKWSIISYPDFSPSYCLQRRRTTAIYICMKPNKIIYL